MELKLNGKYLTRNNEVATITYIQPSDIIDEYPVIGYVTTDNIKLGICWSLTGEAGESMEFDLKEAYEEHT